MRQQAGTRAPTRRLTILYIMALSTIALLTLLGQVAIQVALQQQSSDALIINIAGRQRMLSQRLSKAALALEVFSDPQMRQQNADELQAVVSLWQRSQEGLQHGDAALGLPSNQSTVIKRLFAALGSDYRAILQATEGLLALVLPDKVHISSAPSSAFLPFIRTILVGQARFLPGMDRIVSQYQHEAEEHVTRLRQIELTLLFLTLLTLLLEGLFIFRPAVRRLQQTFADLLQAHERVAREEVTRKKAERILALNEALTASQRDSPHARIVAFGHYQVRGKEGIYYNVYQHAIDGQQVFACECLQYQEHMICPHSLTASALHRISGLQPH